MAEKRILRWDVVERIEHYMLMITIPILIITGLPLFMPEFFGIIPGIFTIMGIDGVAVIRIVHRIFGAILILTVIFHLFFHIFVRRRTKIFPTLKDFKDMFATWSYYLGIGKEPPKIGFHDPSAKIIVYWLGSVIGVGLAIITGIMLMFPHLFPANLHKWALLGHDLALIILIFVVVMHIYMSVFFAPHKPLLDAMLVDGYVPEEYVKEHHPIWYEELKKPKKK